MKPEKSVFRHTCGRIRRIHSRRPLQIALLLAAAGALSACGSSGPVTESRLKLGTSVTVTIHDNAPSGIFDDIWDRLDEIESRMSINSDKWSSTELLEVNAAAGNHGVEVSADTLSVLKTGLEISELSSGAFDVTIAPLVDLWQITKAEPQVPPEDAIRAARALVDYREVKVSGTSVYLPEPGMGIDLGGVAKGYAAAEASRLLRERDIEHAILDFGGDVVGIGTRPDGSPWRIGLQDPRQQRGSLMGVVQVQEAATVTSGIYERYFMQDDVRYHHLIDAATGYPVRNSLTSVTVVTADATVADALSTAAFVMGLEDGLELLEELDDVEGIFVTDAEKVHLTSGLTEKFRLLSGDYSLACSDAEPIPKTE